MIFTGRHHHKIDKKNRVSLPASFRHEFQHGKKSENSAAQELDILIYLHPSPEKHAIEGYDRGFLNEIQDKLAKMNRFDDKYQFFIEYYFKNSIPVSLDEQGRFSMPKDLMERYDLDGECVFVGCGKNFEIHQVNEAIMKPHEMPSFDTLKEAWA